MVLGKNGLKMVQKKEYNWSSGKLDGKYVEWYESGQEKTKGNIPMARRRELGLNIMPQEKKVCRVL